MTLMTTMCLTSGLFILVGVVMSTLLNKMIVNGPKHDRGYSHVHGDKYNTHVGLRSCAGNQYLRNRVNSEPRWVSLMLKCTDWFCLLWTEERLTMVSNKKPRAKSIRCKAKLARRKSRKGRHYKRVWGCAKAARLAYAKAAERKRQSEAVQETYQSYAAQWFQGLPDHDDLSIDFSDVPGLIPRPTGCACQECHIYCQTVTKPCPTVQFAKSPQASKVTFCTAHVLLLIMGIVFMFLCAPIAAMDLGDGNKSLIGKLPPFLGKKDDVIMWLAKELMALVTMGAFAAAIARNMYGSFGEANCPKNETQFNALNESTAADKPKIEAWKCNSKAFAALTLSLPNKLFRIIAALDGQAAEHLLSQGREEVCFDTVVR